MVSGRGIKRFSRRPRLASLILIIAAWASMLPHGAEATAQAEGKGKPYQEWSKQEVTRLLNDSPWARTQVIRVAARQQLRSVAGQVSATPSAAGDGGRAALGGAEEAINYSFTIRLRSALPIRQAIVRLV